jgi:UDP-N-acetylmuramate: L-alanyl-gamma-D-glutamyl-meso-diaminopimelate ligase
MCLFPPELSALRDSRRPIFASLNPILWWWEMPLPGDPEVEYLLRTRRFAFTSLPDLLGSQLLKNRPRVVITGTHGKTTTTALTAWLLKQAGGNPGWLIGGVPNSLPSGSELGEAGSPFVLEGDEYDSAFFDKRSKFIHYRPDVLVINNIEFDHADIFRDLADVKRTFNHLIRIVPDNGLILANGDDPAVLELLPVKWTRVIFVGTGSGNDFIISGFSENPEGSSFKVLGAKGEEWEVQTGLKGIFNARNTTMALLAAGAAMDSACPQSLLGSHNFETYQGVARRQDVLFSSDRLEVIEDFAHHPTAIGLCIDSFRNCYPGHEVVSVFEPRSNTSATNVMQVQFTKALSKSDRVFISPVHRGEIYSDTVRINPRAMQETLSRTCVSATACRSKESLFEGLLELPEASGRIVLLFTNGSFGPPLKEYLRRLKG